MPQVPSRTDKYTSTLSSQLYSDVLVNLDENVDTHDALRVTNEESVKLSVRNLLLTNKYERPFQPDLGSNIRKSLFEPMTPQTQARLQNDITTVITNHEPRAALISVQVDMYPLRDAYVATITFYVRNQSEPVTLQTLLYRAR